MAIAATYFTQEYNDLRMQEIYTALRKFEIHIRDLEQRIDVLQSELNAFRRPPDPLFALNRAISPSGEVPT